MFSRAAAVPALYDTATALSDREPALVRPKLENNTLK